MSRKKLIGGSGALGLLAMVAFLAGGISLGTSHAQTAPSALAAARQPQLVHSAQLVQTQTTPTPVAPAAAPTEVAGTPEPTEVAGTPEPTEVAGAAEPTEVAGAAESKGAGETAEAPVVAPAGSITPQQAEQTALAANPGTTVVKTDLGNDNGTFTYTVELSNHSEVQVDAKTGKILSTAADGSEGGD